MRKNDLAGARDMPTRQQASLSARPCASGYAKKPRRRKRDESVPRRAFSAPKACQKRDVSATEPRRECAKSAPLCAEIRRQNSLNSLK